MHQTDSKRKVIHAGDYLQCDICNGNERNKLCSNCGHEGMFHDEVSGPYNFCVVCSPPYNIHSFLW